MLLDRGHDVRVIYQGHDSLLDAVKFFRDRLLYAGVSDWLRQFRGAIKSFEEISDCRFEKDEIIVAVGTAMSAQMGSLMSVPNAKLQYIHGATPWHTEVRDRALKLPLPKVVVASYLKTIAEETGRGEVLAVIHNGIYRDEYFASVPESGRDGLGLIYSRHPAKDPKATLSILEEISKRQPRLSVRVFSSDRRPREIAPRSYWRYPSLEKAREIYSQSKVWVLASRSEGFPAPVLEAMACGCCVVATDCGGTRDSIVDGENGFIVPVGDVSEIMNKIEQLLNNDDLRQRMRIQAQRTVDIFTWKNCVDKLEGVLRAIA